MRHSASFGFVVASLLAVAACAPGVAAPAGAPAADPAALARALTTATIPAQPEQIGFGWELSESGSKLRGRGVARIEAPQRARLDLFGPRGESYLAAALVNGEFRLPGGASPAIPLPSQALLWAAVGVIQPPQGAALEGATTTDSVAVVRYRAANGEEFRYRIRTAPAPTLVQLERIGGSGVLETVTIDRGSDGRLQQVRYRDWAAYRDLTLDVESIKHTTGFSDEIWRP